MSSRALNAWWAIISKAIVCRPVFPTLSMSCIRMQGWLMHSGFAGGGVVPEVTSGWKS